VLGVSRTQTLGSSVVGAVGRKSLRSRRKLRAGDLSYTNRGALGELFCGGFDAWTGFHQVLLQHDRMELHTCIEAQE
jgi:hypothetical protein